VIQLIGKERATEMELAALSIYQRAQEYAHKRGVIIADTKMEFGIDSQGQMVLGDEVLTPDSSRFWNLDSYTANRPQERYISSLEERDVN
jgi:phosphoribosylaminoimidazole-succinocarboxamide synthase